MLHVFHLSHWKEIYMKLKKKYITIRRSKKFLFPVLSIIFALLISALIIEIISGNSLFAIECLIKGGFGGVNALAETLVKSTSLIFMALSFAFSQRSGMYNLGGMGQFYIGAILGGWVGTSIPNLTTNVHIPLMLLCGFIGGALYALIPALLKLFLNANELISTIMFNSVALQILSYAVSGPMKDPNSLNNASQSRLMMDSVKLHVLVKGTRLHIGFLFALIALTIFWFFYSKTSRGYEIRIVGMSAQVAQYAGMNIRSNRIITMIIGGGLAGIGGCIELMSVQSRLVQGFSSELSFQGISVALLGDCSPIGILLSSILFGALNSGAKRMQMLAEVPISVIDIAQSLMILFLAGSEVFKHKDLFIRGFSSSIISRLSNRTSHERTN
jgi:simple sugar transport system permease protein